MNILHTRRRIALALMLAGALALPVATPVDAAAQNRPGQYLEKGGNGKGKQQQAQRGQKGNRGKVREQANRAQNRAHRQQQQANRAQNRARQAEAQAQRARQNERRAEQQARRQHQQVRQAERNARQAQVRAAEQRAQARAARERAEARAHRNHQQRIQQQRIQKQRIQQQRVHRQHVQQHRAPVRRQSVGGRHYHPFYASPIYVQRHRPQWRNNVFAVDGYMQDDGYQCVQLRDDQGNPYILEGRVEGLFAGDHVRLVAREAPFSSCGGYGRPVVVTRVVRVWADPHHRSAYFQANIDGAFDNWARWRRGDDWLREPRFYDGPYDDGYSDDYYFDGYDYDEDDYAYYDDGGW